MLWFPHLPELDFESKHLSEKYNVVADVMSRNVMLVVCSADSPDIHSQTYQDLWRYACITNILEQIRCHWYWP